MKRLSLAFLALTLVCQAIAQNADADEEFLRANYDQSSFMIPMRDGTKLFTLVYSPKEKGKKYPILMSRTCYNVASYENWRLGAHFSNYFPKDGYFLVFQDVRGRYRSEGTFDNMTPNIPGNKRRNKTDIDESSDTYDTIEFLLKNLKGNNGKVGMTGISYPGFYTSAALPDAHPALVASSPQAPIADFYFDDFHHMGAFTLGYTYAFPVFGYQKPGITDKAWYGKGLQRFAQKPHPDGYRFYLDLGPLKNITEQFHFDNFFWKQHVEHPNYDDFWRKRDILPHLRDIDHAVMTVGGWYDAEDLYGPLNTYKTIEKHNPKAKNTLVMGPWGHGDWTRERGAYYHNEIYFGDSLATYFLRDVERKFFAHHLHGGEAHGLPEALMFNTGLRKWESFDQWPDPNAGRYTLTFGEGGRLHTDGTPSDAVHSYVSDPAKPVPYRSQIEGLRFTPRPYMTDDQRHASKRPDVLTFQTDVLEEEVTLSGEIFAKLKVSVSETDADFVVKLIDVYADDHPQFDQNPKNVIMAGYQQLIRGEVFRGRFREDFAAPKPFVPNEVTAVEFPLQDVHHTFKKGHRIMVQIQSTWFPYIDRNPQKYVDNIFLAEEADFVPATIRIHGGSTIEVGGDVYEGSLK